MKKALAIGIALLSGPALAQDFEKELLAARFYEATIAKQIDEVVKSAGKAILREDPSKVRQSEIYQQWAKEVFHSNEYKAIYVQFWIENFDRDELKAMNDWAQSPLFVRYSQKWQNFPQWSAPRFQAYMKKVKPELERRLQAEGLK